MKDIDSIKPEAEGQGFQFPGLFEMTAMGNASAVRTMLFSTCSEVTVCGSMLAVSV